MLLDQLLFNKTSNPAVLKSLDASMLRSRVISNNIANVTTPGYQRVEVSFEGELRKALDRTRLQGARTNEKHLEMGRLDMGRVQPHAYKPIDPTLSSGVNNVDIDMEMSKLAENQLQYEYGLRFLRTTYRKIDAAAQEKSMPLQ
jgi:flagellar basal-body rod protein FlgB